MTRKIRVNLIRFPWASTFYPWELECDSSPGIKKTSFTWEFYLLLLRIRRKFGVVFLYLLLFQKPLAKNDRCANVSYFGLAYSATLYQLLPYFLMTKPTDQPTYLTKSRLFSWTAWSLRWFQDWNGHRRPEHRTLFLASFLQPHRSSVSTVLHVHLPLEPLQLLYWWRGRIFSTLQVSSS